MIKIDIISINSMILEKFNDNINKLSLQNNNIDNIINNNFLSKECYQELLKVYSLKEECIKNKTIYIAETALIIREYLKLLKQPISYKKSIDDLRKIANKNEIIYKFINIVKEILIKNKWNDIILPSNNGNNIGSYKRITVNDSNNYCESCGNIDQEKFDCDDNNKKTCLSCFTQINTVETGLTHQDYSRVNIVGKFVYNRILHFQDYIKQFQGKQNCKIPDQVYKDLDSKFESYRLLLDSENYHARYSKITPQHIQMFLKQLQYTKHYENVNVIYYSLTNKRVADIGHLEHKLIEDFKELVCLYDSLHSKDKPEELDRKNFMNVQYLLFQLLRRHGYKCRIDDFAILKTSDRKMFHDKICSNLFEKLGWNFTPTF